jgi:hypothetical protein
MPEGSAPRDPRIISNTESAAAAAKQARRMS